MVLAFFVFFFVFCFGFWRSKSFLMALSLCPDTMPFGFWQVCEGAGKLEATVYVRSKLGFPPQRTVTCGDSGNDILMLSGRIIASQ